MGRASFLLSGCPFEFGVLLIFSGSVYNVSPILCWCSTLSVVSRRVVGNGMVRTVLWEGAASAAPYPDYADILITLFLVSTIHPRLFRRFYRLHLMNS